MGVNVSVAMCLCLSGSWLHLAYHPPFLSDLAGGRQARKLASETDG